jgi:hypothetical protein
VLAKPTVVVIFAKRYHGTARTTEIKISKLEIQNNIYYIYIYYIVANTNNIHTSYYLLQLQIRANESI